MRLDRIVPGIGLSLLMLVLVGCGNKPTPPSGNTSNTGSPTKTSSTEVVKGGAGVELVKAFAASMLDGKPDLAKLSMNFKKLIAPPALGSDKERGYSEWAAGEWFKPLAKQITPGDFKETELASGILVVTSGSSAKSGPVLAKLVKEGNDWKIDWFQVGVTGTDAGLTSSEKAEEFAFLAFLNAALNNQQELAESLLTLSLKTRIAPPLPGDQGFNKGILSSKLSQFRGAATGYTLGKRNLGPETGVVDGILLATTDPKTRPFTVKLVKGTKPGEWLVDDFEPR